MPSFQFQNIPEALQFIRWVKDNDDKLRHAGNSTTNHGRIKDFKPVLRGSCVDLHMRLRTGDATGQNICTIAAEAVSHLILDTSSLRPQHWFIDSGSASDKKGSPGFIHNGRGIEVTGEVTIPKDILWSRLRAKPDKMIAFHTSIMSRDILNGTVGSHLQVSNGLAAMFIACGQDVACVAESHAALTQIRKTSGGDIQIALTMPCLMMGTVGGGTSLPSQKVSRVVTL